jgi:anti-sigma factor RsiW
MECNDVQEKLSAYVEGIISPEERTLIDEHLTSCLKCNESFADLKKTVEYIHNLEDIEPPTWLTQKVMARIRSEAKSDKGILQKLFYPLHIKLPIEAVAVIVIAVTALYIFKTIQPVVRLAKTPSEHVRTQIPLQEKDTLQKEAKGMKEVIARDEVQKQSQKSETETREKISLLPSTFLHPFHLFLP